MNVLIFNGCSDSKPETTGRKLAAYLHEQLTEKGFTVTQLHVSEADIPFFDLHQTQPPATVRDMCDAFLQADLQIWLTPLYHGSMTGMMKNCLDWLELTARHEKPYLTDKIVGLVAWADGGSPQGNPKDLPPAPKFVEGWEIGQPDAVVSMVKPFDVPASGTVVAIGASVLTGDPFCAAAAPHVSSATRQG